MTSDEKARRSAVPRVLLLAWAVVAVGLGWSPVHRQDWLLEHLLVVVFLGCLLSGLGRRVFSTASYVMIFGFLILHEIGAHYTYSQVPLPDWLGGPSEGDPRNHYDRIVHFSFGLLMTCPARDLVLSGQRLHGARGRFLPLTLIVTASTIYELLEWAAAELLGGAEGLTFVGAQGDIWDAQKDVSLAVLGALIAGALIAIGEKRSAGRDYSSRRRSLNSP